MKIIFFSLTLSLALLNLPAFAISKTDQQAGCMGCHQNETSAMTTDDEVMEKDAEGEEKSFN